MNLETFLSNWMLAKEKGPSSIQDWSLLGSNASVLGKPLLAFWNYPSLKSIHRVDKKLRHQSGNLQLIQLSIIYNIFLFGQTFLFKMSFTYHTPLLSKIWDLSKRKLIQILSPTFGWGGINWAQICLPQSNNQLLHLITCRKLVIILVISAPKTNHWTWVAIEDGRVWD